MAFEEVYYRPSSKKVTVMSVHRQVDKNVLVYMSSFNPSNMRGVNFTIEKFSEEGKLLSKLSSTTVAYDTALKKWQAEDYYIREINDGNETFKKGAKIDTTLKITPDDIARDPGIVGTMTYKELDNYIDLLILQGSDELKLFLIEKYRRFANPFAVFILTLIGVSLSSRKVRGGIGMNIGIGLILSFSYILFLQFASQFSLKGNLDPLLAMWIPNILYAIIAAVLYKMAPK